MEDFRHSSHHMKTGGSDGRNFKIIDANMFKYVNKVYLSRTHPSYGPSLFDQNPIDKKKKTRSSSSSITSWFNEPKMKRKMRLTKYKMYALEGKIKDSLKKGKKWIKKKYRKHVHGF
ncbi:hypothetical protein ERO13_A08G206800v2 [Gossypium hirsutum]|uniref:DUF3511 domain-containing protein n=4 Tax=Gossypium TaxID=3633 RepID=A0A5J5UV71_GOSBA|nr:hypothetical protein ES319_A08G219100v1 [Gossypium barbadense]KAG4189108.1 hypothetical protein ERO13_A08G206800v2 [Gossypium hirsutum]TYH07542.1 hypothetical protein ES288_A08G242300v1 [Gossypium darwinii]TYI16235.1 hypothetical protein ES332_A08G241700v1 [Gossypium tomentosum]TYJ23931.1 hypothetical protein E1A91_A08G226400v1 [Gossypium mustelinum]